MTSESSTKFDAARAGEYAAQSRIALAGYEACHELSACMLAAHLGRNSASRLLVVGAGGTCQEVLTCARIAPAWRFTAVDPSAPMLESARASVMTAGLADRVDFRLAHLTDLPTTLSFDAATLVGVLHHLPTRAEKEEILGAVASRLPAGAPFILAGNRFAYESRPAFMAAWAERWHMHGATDAEVQAKMGKILQGAVPPSSDEEVGRLLVEAGFDEPVQFFSSLFWGAWLTVRT
jgi:tRNA (cmo5U34)-methyltransferase